MLFLRLLPLILCFSGLVHAEHRVFTRKDGFLSMRDKLNVYFFRSDTHRLLVRDEGSVKTPRYGSLDKAMRKSPCEDSSAQTRRELPWAWSSRTANGFLRWPRDPSLFPVSFTKEAETD